MNVSFKYFLVVAEELNITRAAKKLFISQQSLSNHIKRLETQYNTTLFQRYPTLELTEDGVIFAEAIQKILSIEEGLRGAIGEGHELYRETITLGLTWSRAAILIPDIVPAFHQEYPNVQITVHNDSSTNVENRLLQGYLDLVISSNESDNEQLEKIRLIEEKLYLVVSNSLLKAHFGARYPACVARFQQGVDLREFTEANVPFTINTPRERLYQAIQACLKENKLELDIIFQTDSADIRSQLCAQGFSASIFSEFLLQYIFRNNRCDEDGAPLNIFPIQNAYESYAMNLYYNKLMHHSRYVRFLVNHIMEISNRYQYQSEAFGNAQSEKTG